MGDLVADDYVYVDGEYIDEKRLVKMAECADSHQTAEHYTNFLLLHGIRKRRWYLADVVDNIRKVRNLPVIPASITTPTSPDNMPSYNRTELDKNIIARKKYKKFDDEKKQSVVKNSLVLLMIKDKTMFKRQIHWIGIYIVIRDRLDNMNQKDFHIFARKCVPSDWNEKLQISPHTMSNLGRYLKEEKDIDYFEMTNNPFEDLCETFWSILRNEILTA